MTTVHETAVPPTAPAGRVRWPVPAAALATPLVAFVLWSVAHAYAAGHGAPAGDNDFAWMPVLLGVVGVAVVLPVAVLIALVSLAPFAQRRGVQIGLASAVTVLAVAVVGLDFVFAGLATQGDPEGFPSNAVTTALLVVGATVSLLPAALLWVWVERFPAGVDRGELTSDEQAAGQVRQAWLVLALLAGAVGLFIAPVALLVLGAQVALPVGSVSVALMVVAALLAPRPQRYWLLGLAPLLLLAAFAASILYAA